MIPIKIKNVARLSFIKLFMFFPRNQKEQNISMGLRLLKYRYVSWLSLVRYPITMTVIDNKKKRKTSTGKLSMVMYVGTSKTKPSMK
jgi:hypothetical protein